jgi:hypothetical protein
MIPMLIISKQRLRIEIGMKVSNLLNRVLLLLTGLLLVSCAQLSSLLPEQATPIPTQAGWDLVWHDEFDGSTN